LCFTLRCIVLQCVAAVKTAQLHVRYHPLQTRKRGRERRHTHANTHAHTYTRTHTRAQAHTHTPTHPHMHTHTHTHTHTYTHIHTHTQTCLQEVIGCLIENKHEHAHVHNLCNIVSAFCCSLLQSVTVCCYVVQHTHTHTLTQLVQYRF